MSHTFHLTADVDEMQPYKWLTGLVVPRPIGWIGTRSGSGVRNLAPFSFFNAVAGTPPIVMFAPTAQPDARKDTLDNVRDTGEFSVNVVSHFLRDQMVASSGTHAPEVDEFEITGLTAIEGCCVSAPLVGEALANLECTVVTITELGRAPMGSSVVFGEVVGFRLADVITHGTRIDPDALDAVGRMAGSTYSTTRDRFELERPG